MRFIASILAASLAVAGMASAQEVIVYTSYEKEDLVPYKAAFEKDVPGVHPLGARRQRRHHRAPAGREVTNSKASSSTTR